MAIFRRQSSNINAKPQSKSLRIIDGLEVEVTRKRMKYLRLKVSPPNGKVSLSAPHRASNKEIDEMIRQRLDWVREQQEDIASRPQTPAPQFLDGDTHPLWGQPFSLAIKPHSTRSFARTDSDNQQILLFCRGARTAEQRSQLLDDCYRQQLQQVLPELAQKWQGVVGRKANFWGIKKMKTRWGSCNTQRARIWLNLELVKYPRECLEYVIVHELAHLYEANHSPRFYQLLDTFMPHWQQWSEQLKHGEL